MIITEFKIEKNGEMYARVRGEIPYDSLSDSFKKSIDSIEDNLNK